VADNKTNDDICWMMNPYDWRPHQQLAQRIAADPGDDRKESES
jgi:hypothetical protein